MSNPRRDFLGWLGASGLAAAAGASLPADLEAEDPLAAASSKWDLSWTKRVKGKARGVFDVFLTDGQGGFSRAMTWRTHATEVYGPKANGVSLVVVFRHQAIPFVMNDEFWDRFKIREELKMPEGRGGAPPTTRNPIGTPAPNATDVQKRNTITSFLESGGIVLACNLAFQGPVNRIARADSLPREAADTKARTFLLPGVILQPSGLFALIASQQAGCGMVPANF